LNIPSNFRVEAARRIQTELGHRIIEEDRLPQEVKTVGGVDAAYRGELAAATCVVLDYASLRLLEAKTAKAKVIFPYIPTLLSFREAPPIFKVFRLLEVKPDVLIVNGHGVAHPYGCGLASYVGVILKQPTIGVASRLLCGEVGPKIGDIAPVIYGGRTVGAALFTEARRPIYISVGNMVSLERAAALTRSLLCGSRMPAPLKVADALAKRTVRRLEV